MEIRRAIKVHHTDISDKSWDAGKNKKNLKLDQDAKYYMQAFAWRDEKGDESSKNTYKFIHHEVSSNGNIGAANVNACVNGIAILNGARGGTKIPKKDYQGVYNHLAAHLKDADREPAKLQRDDEVDIERRCYNTEFRISKDNKSAEGYVAVFNELSNKIDYFREKIRSGAFTKTIQEADIRALFNHNVNYVLGRNKAGTLELSEDSKGLYSRISFPNTSYANDLRISIERGDINHMSFGFKVIKEDWSLDDEHGAIRELQEVKLFDISIVTFPAYPQTSVSLRSYFPILSSDPDALFVALKKMEMRKKLSNKELQIINEYISNLKGEYSNKNDSEPFEKHSDPEPFSIHSELKKLELLELEIGL